MNIGGPALHAVILTQGLNGPTQKSLLVSGAIATSEGDMAYIARERGVTPLLVPELGREVSLRSDLIALWKLYRICRRERPDIVHTHMAKAGTLGRIAALLAWVPVRIHTFHGHVFHSYFSSWKTRGFLLIERLLARVTTAFVAISDRQLEELADTYRIAPRRKFRMIPLGLELGPFLSMERPPARLQTGDQQSTTVIGLVGRLVPIKNPQMALQVLHRVISMGREEGLRLVFVGDGELRADLEGEAHRLGLSGKVVFAGWQQDLPTLYSRLDVVIVTSFNEGTPVVLLEAMASGLPFVATRVGGIPDLTVGSEQVMRGEDGRTSFSVFDNGILVESGDIEGFGAAVAYLLGNPSRRDRMGLEGRKVVAERYSKERLIRDTQNLYSECLSRRPAET